MTPPAERRLTAMVAGIAPEIFMQVRAPVRSSKAAPAEATVSAGAAEYWKERGFFPVPVAHRQKSPTINGSEHPRIDMAEVGDYFSRSPQNIGVLLGDHESGDVEIDSIEALAVAPEFLPNTELKGDRKSKPASHSLRVLP